jgi:hypothetical protein
MPVGSNQERASIADAMLCTDPRRVLEGQIPPELAPLNRHKRRPRRFGGHSCPAVRPRADQAGEPEPVQVEGRDPRSRLTQPGVRRP